ncbi:hypothetical protein [Hyalangium versicolor]|uniref:hypothetical protein n=1 Tax=Hyalangium versicolor TaxID=2861190 RepID=UPI001CD0373A|nr:hypothetical protein [Hyalangium versicolor]
MSMRIGGSSFSRPAEVRSEPQKVQQKAEQPQPSSSFQNGASSFESGRRAPVALNVPPPPPPVQTPQASSLRTERLGDGRSNCLEKAATLARPGDSVVLFSDKRDSVGHAVVQHPDGSVTDPNRPTQNYSSMQAWQQANPQYQSPVSVPQETLSRVLSLPPGAQRDQALKEAGLSAVAGRNVADGPAPGTLGELGYLTVTVSGGLNIRSNPQVSDQTWLGKIPAGTVLVVQPPPPGVTPPDDGKNWTYVRSPPLQPNGQPIEGWVSADAQYVEKKGPPSPSTTGTTPSTGNTTPVTTPTPVTSVPVTAGTPAETAAAMFTEAQGRLNTEAPPDTTWDYRCLPFVSDVAQATGIKDPALTYSQTPKDVIATLQSEGRLHPMSEPPPPGAIVLWDKGGYPDTNGNYVQTGHAAIATGDPSKPYITTKVSDESGVTQRGINSLEADAQGNWSPTPPVGWFIPENPS